MQPNPLVTVAMVSYNSSAYIRMAIESVLCSSYQNLELIIADDCSSDDTWSIIQRYTDPRIRAVRNEKNIGEYPNRNQCVNMAKGEYLVFIDGDDVIYPHGLEFMVKMLHAFPQCSMALLRWYRKNIIYPAVITPHQFYTGEYFGCGFLGTSFANVFFRLNVLKEQGGVISNYQSGDDYIRYKIALKHNCLLINDGMTWWRETPGQVSAMIQKSGQQLIKTYQLKFEFLRNGDCPLSAGEKKQATANLYLVLLKLMMRCMINGNIKKGILILKKFRVPLKYFFEVYKKPIKKDPFEQYSPRNPFHFPFQQNPFSPYAKSNEKIF